MELLSNFIIKIWPLTSGDVAAWVQAIGSIGAVLATLIVVLIQFWYQKYATKRDHQLLVKRYISTFISLSGGIAQKADLLNQWAINQNGKDLRFMRAEVGTICNAMEDLPLWQMDTFEEIVTIVCLKTHATVLLESLTKAEINFQNSIAWNQAVLSELSTLIPDLNKKLPLLIKLRQKYT
jgi:hypothetical protein